MGWDDWSNWANVPPVADAGPDQTATVWQEITFDGSGSYDPNGYIVSWYWDFGDLNTANGEIVYHRYDKSKTYTVTLQVTDNNGAVSNDSCSITITPLLLKIKICSRPSPTMEYGKST